MNSTKLMIETTSFAAIGTGMGYASTLILPTINPIAGAINGFCFGLIMSKTGKSLSEIERKELPVKDKMIHIAIVNISLVASAALSFLICLSLNNPVSFSACLIFPWLMGFSCALVLLPVQIIIKTAELVHNTYLRLTT